MCIVFLWRRNASQPKGRIKFVLAGNRDEFFHRPAKDADYWDENSNVLGGELVMLTSLNNRLSLKLEAENI